ncbi:MAG TPA: ATP-binding cassette domain-containing protein [Candidatus Krumholzibacteria bacterium]|nr:ATP-binding cassette domain-containing protein [Candidatus Krumholzibacteria bacterium]
MPAIDIRQVSKRFGTFTAVDDLTLTVPAGCVQGFLGPNGAGKTTTLRMVMNIFAPDSGTIHVLGERMSEPLKKRIGYLPEERGLYRKMRVLEMLVFFAALKGLPEREGRRRAQDWLQRFGLEAWGRRFVRDLSKGMQQKVGFIATMLHDPELVVLDEPFSGLDPVNLEFVRDVILDLKRRGRTVVFSTHQMDEAEKLCDRIFMILAGRKVLDGSLDEVRTGRDQVALVEYRGEGGFLQRDADVLRVNDYGQYSEISLRPGAEPSALLRRMAERLQVLRFELRQPTLHEIFVRTVRDGGGDVEGLVGTSRERVGG